MNKFGLMKNEQNVYMRNPCQVLACMLRRDEEHGWPNGHNARQTTAPTCSYNCFPLFSRFRRPWTTKGDLTIHWGLVSKHQKNPTMEAMWIPKSPSWEHRSHSTWTNLGQNERYQVPAVWQSQDPSCWNLLKILYKVCVKKIKVSWAFSI